MLLLMNVSDEALTQIVCSFRRYFVYGSDDLTPESHIAIKEAV